MTGQRPGYIVLILFAILILSVSDSWAISWNNDLNSALNEAKKNEKPLIVDFYTTWCQWCKELDYNTYTDAKVNELSGNFICVKVDAEQSPQEASKYNIRGYPTVIFLNYDGSINNRVIGYKDPEAFAGVMELVLKNTKSPPGKVPSEKTGQAVIKGPAIVKADDVKFDKEEFKRKRRKNIEKARNHNLELSGIIIDKKKTPVAIINDIFVREGDIIGEGKVSKITKDKAEVVFQDKTIILTID